MQDQHRGTTDDSCTNAELTTTAGEPTLHARERPEEINTYTVIGLTDVLNAIDRSARTRTDLWTQKRVLQALGVATGGVGLLIVIGWICSAAKWLPSELVTYTLGAIATPIGLCWLAVVIQVFRREGPT